MRTSRQRYRRAYAVIAALLWLVGVEVIPNVHLAYHADDHTHDATSGAIVRVTFAQHAHDDGTVHAHAAESGPKRTNREHAILDDEVPSGHAAAGLAHRAAALHQPPPPALAPIEVPPNEHRIAAAPAARLASRSLARPAARGPPVA
jgi:hypothetical protein